MVHFGGPETLEACLRLAAALLLGSIIGFERQWHQKMAGLRTNALVALGASGFVVFADMASGPDGDPTRVAAQIVSGIGFLGAGVILREGVNVHGLNTAATLWCSAMVGTFAGAGLLVPSALAATFIVITNLVLRPIVRRMNIRMGTRGDVETHYSIEVTCRGSEEAQMRSRLLDALGTAGLGLRRLDSDDIPDTGLVRVTAQAAAPMVINAALERLVGGLSLEPTVTGVSWRIDRTIPES